MKTESFVELSSGIVIVNDQTVFCNCVLTNDIIEEAILYARMYNLDINKLKFYVPERFNRYSIQPISKYFIKDGTYNKYVSGQLLIGGFIYIIE